LTCGASPKLRDLTEKAELDGLLIGLEDHLTLEEAARVTAGMDGEQFWEFVVE
jgi:hypothetical protein